MKMSVIIGVIHMTFGLCLSFFNYWYVIMFSIFVHSFYIYSFVVLVSLFLISLVVTVFSRHFGQIRSVFFVLIPELIFMMCLFGYLVFMLVFKWIVYTPAQSEFAPSILIHFIDMFLFRDNPQNPLLYTGQVCVVCSFPEKEHVTVLTHILQLFCLYFSSFLSKTTYILCCLADHSQTSEVFHKPIYTLTENFLK